MGRRAATGGESAPLLVVGQEVVSCGHCGRPVAADLNHAGDPLNSHNRGYCDRTCRGHARNARRRADTDPAALAARHLRTALIARHDLEAAGQLELTGLPLPPVPPQEHTVKHPTGTASPC